MRLQLPAVLTAVRENLTVFSFCLLSVAGLLTFTVDRDWSQASSAFAGEIAPPPQTHHGAYSDNHYMKPVRDVQSKGNVSPTVKRILDGDFRASLSRVAKWREQHRRLVMYRQKQSSGAEPEPSALPSSPDN